MDIGFVLSETIAAMGDLPVDGGRMVKTAAPNYSGVIDVTE